MIAEQKAIRSAAVTALFLFSVLAQAQRTLLGEAARPAAKPAVVQYLYPEQITVPAGKPSTIALHFRIAPGLPINSHPPKEVMLIPPRLSIPADSGVRIDEAVYPPGRDYTLPLDSKTRLSVYADEFVIQTRIVAAVGDHLVEAKLRYQACDNSECMPPKTITAAIDVIAK